MVRIEEEKEVLAPPVLGQQIGWGGGEIQVQQRDRQNQLYADVPTCDCELSDYKFRNRGKRSEAFVDR